MKIRLTLLTENDKHVDVPKEKLEQITKDGWRMFLDMIVADGGKNEKVTIEKCEVVEM